MAEVYLGGDELPMRCVFCGEPVIRLQRIHYAVEAEREVCISLPICKADCLDSYDALVNRVQASLDTDWGRPPHRRHRMRGVAPAFARAYKQLQEQQANEWEADLARPQDPKAQAGNALFAGLEPEDDEEARRSVTPRRRGEPRRSPWVQVLLVAGVVTLAMVVGLYTFLMTNWWER